MRLLSGRSAVCCGRFAQFLCRAVGKAQNSLGEIFVVLRLLGQDFETVALNCIGRREMEMAGACEDRACDLAVDFAVKQEVAAHESKGGRIALEHQIINRNCRSAGKQSAELVIDGVGVGRGGEAGCVGDMESQEDNKQASESMRNPSS